MVSNQTPEAFGSLGSIEFYHNIYKRHQNPIPIPMTDEGLGDKA